MRLLTAPTEEPVSLDEAKFAARLTGSTAFDAMLPVYIQAAREIAENETCRRLMAQVWRLEMVDWPTAADLIPIHAASTVAISYWSTTGEWIDLVIPLEDGEDPPARIAFAWADADPGLALAPLLGEDWPALGEVAIGPRIRVDITVGAADAADVPAAAKAFITAMVAYWIENPQAYTDRPHMASPAALCLLDSIRVGF